MNTKILNCINGFRHQDYERVVKLAKFCRTIVTGENYGDLVRSYKDKETEEEKAQRVAITMIRTKAAAGKIESFFKRPFRIDKLKFEVSHKDNTKSNLLSSHIDVYGNDGTSALRYCEETALYYNGIDPNAFYWVKDSIENKKYTFDPIIFTSDTVYDFAIKKGNVEYAVICMNDSVNYSTKDGVKTEIIPTYYCFTKEGIEIAVKYVKEVAENSPYYYQQYIDNSDVEPMTELAQDSTYLVTFQKTESKSGITPLARVGYNYDKLTDKRTFVPYWDNASEIYRMMANTGSEFDITMNCHVFMKKYEYVEDCNYQDGSSKQTCVDGYLSPSKDKVKCPKCHGEGTRTLISGQQVIKLRIPRTSEGETMALKPSDMEHYVTMPFEVVRFQSELLDTYYPKISEAIFGIDLTEKLNSAATATEVLNNTDMAQDAIYEFTKAPKDLFLFTVEVIAGVENISEYTAALEYPREYSLESEEYLIKILGEAQAANASPEIIENIIKRLALKQNRTDSSFMSVWETMRKFVPFSGVEQSIREAIILGLPASDPQRALALNLKEITEDIMNEQQGFLLKSYKEQKKIVDEKAQKIAERATVQERVLTITELNNNL